MYVTEVQSSKKDKPKMENSGIPFLPSVPRSCTTWLAHVLERSICASFRLAF